MRKLRELLTVARIREQHSWDTIRWATATGRWTQIIHGVLGRGPAPPSLLDKARATALVTDGIALGTFAADLLRFDSVEIKAIEVAVLRGRSVRRTGVRNVQTLPREHKRRVGQVRVQHPADVLHGQARTLDDDTWEQAMEFCLRKRYIDKADLATWAAGTDTTTADLQPPGPARRPRRSLLARTRDVPRT